MEKAHIKTEKSFVPQVKHLQATDGVTVRICTIALYAHP